MGLFDKLSKIIEEGGKVVSDSLSSVLTDKENIVPAPSSHMAEDEAYGNNGRYRISFRVNDAFREAKSHAGEIEMLHTYAPGQEYGEEGAYPYLAIQMDDEVYSAVEQFKQKGSFAGAVGLTPLSGKFYFRAKMEYYEHMMYFYGMDRCGGFWENNGLCMVYPKACVGTQDEKRLMQILDEAAASYQEEKVG